MLYKVRKAQILGDGQVVEGKRTVLKVWPYKLKVGGLYFLGNKVGGNKLYQVIEEVSQ